MTKKLFSFTWLTTIFGSNWTNGTNGGGFIWNANNSSATQNRNHGTRLVNAKLNNVLFLLPCLLAKYKKNDAVLVGSLSNARLICIQN